MHSSTSIVPFRARHASAFRDLNLTWISRFFSVEKKDLEALEDPCGKILHRGGAILIAENEAGGVMGCVALLRLGDGRFELAKMAVAESEQGRGVGRMLIEAALAHAEAASASEVYLESNSRLTSAVRLYEKAGFRHLAAHERPTSPYARCDVYMTCRLGTLQRAAS